MIKIGVDPAFRKKGFVVAMLNEENVLSFIVFENFTDFIFWVQNQMPKGNVKICIENSYLQNKTFDMTGNKAVIAKKSRNAGMNQAVSQIAYELFCKYAGKKNVLNLSPKAKGKKWTANDTKIIEGICMQHKITKTKKTWSQDERDAFKLLCNLL